MFKNAEKPLSIASAIKFKFLHIVITQQILR